MGDKGIIFFIYDSSKEMKTFICMLAKTGKHFV